MGKVYRENGWLRGTLTGGLGLGKLGTGPLEAGHSVLLVRGLRLTVLVGPKLKVEKKLGKLPFINQVLAILDQLLQKSLFGFLDSY